MLLLDTGEIKKAELFSAKNEDGLFLLMQNAGKAVAGCADEYFSARKTQSTQRVICLCGCGNNGGDGFVAAEALYKKGFYAEIILVCGQPATKNAKTAFESANKAGVKSTVLDESTSEYVLSSIKSADLIIDAVFGTGFHGSADGTVSEIFTAVNRSSAFVISADIPSGVSCSGEVSGAAVKADRTVSMQYCKNAFITRPGKNYCGKIEYADIGISEKADGLFPDACEVTSENEIKALLPKRDGDLNKGSFGRALIVCGSFGMAGAAIMSARAAMCAGAGLCELLVPRSIYQICAAALPECVFSVYDDFDPDKAIKLLEKCLENASACLVGCGLSTDLAAEEIVLHLISHSKIPLIIDADGINIIAKHIDVLKTASTDISLTPHPGEMGRLLQASAAEVNENRLKLSREFSEKYGVHLLLKGENTVIASPVKRLRINPTGNAGMSKAGFGDVLSGIIVSLSAQGIPCDKALFTAAYIHGKAGEMASERLSRRAMQATDIIEDMKRLFVLYERE